MLLKPKPTQRFIYLDPLPRGPEGEGRMLRSPLEAAKNAKEEGAKEVKAETKTEGDKLVTEVTNNLADPLKQFAPKFLLEISKEVPADELEKIRQAAESDAVTLSDLQGGHDWMGVSENDYEQKYYKLCQAYLTKVSEADGRTVFKIKDELDRNDKVKFGLGAGDLLPPSIHVASITDLNGVSRTGERRIVDERAGYYDQNGYIPVFAGYTIAYGKQASDFIQEDSKEYKDQIDLEKQTYKQRKANEQAYLDGTSKTPEEVLNYAGRLDHPVSNLNTLRTITPEEAAKKLDYLKEADRQEEINRVSTAQTDMLRTEAIVNKLGLRQDPRMEQDGGSIYLALNGTAAKILGWSEDMSKAQGDLLTKLQDKKACQEAIKDLKDGEKKELAEGAMIVKDEKSPDGYYLQTALGYKIINLQGWTAEHIAKKSEKPNNPVTALLHTLQMGGSLPFAPEIKLKGGYVFHIGHLQHLKYAAENPSKLSELLKKLPQQNGSIASYDFIKALVMPESNENPNLRSTGMTLEQAKAYAARLGMGNLLGGPQSLDFVMNMSKGKKSFSIANYQFDDPRLGKHLKFPYNNGTKCCAWASSTFLALGDSPESIGKGKEGGAKGLLAKCMRANIEKSGSPQIVIGYEYMQKGDVLGFGMCKEGEKYIGHVAVIRDRFTVEVNGRPLELLAFQHDQENIQINLVPVRRGDNGLSTALGKALANPATRQAYLNKYPQLAAIYNYRAQFPQTVNVRANAGWYGDSSKGGGNVLFAVRTAGLLVNQPSPQGELV